MINLRTLKILRDLWRNKMRTILVVITIAIGVFAVGSIARSWFLLAQNLTESYIAVNPASATITTSRPFGAEMVKSIQRLPEIKNVEARYVLIVRVNVGIGRWRSLRLMARANYNDLVVNRIAIEQGMSPPPKRTMLIERASMNFVRLNVGDTATIQLADGRLQEIEVAGIVHDLNQIPTLFSYIAYGYVTPETLEAVTGARDFNTLDLVVAEQPFDKAHIQTVTEQVAERLDASNFNVTQKRIPEPGRHPLDNVIQSVLWLLGALAALALFLSTFLVINIISAVLAQQVQQIGILKAIGGRSWVVGSMYASAVVIFSVLALGISVPLGMIMAYFSSIFFASLINFDITHFDIPPYIFGLEILSGLIVPFLAALYPIIAGTRITVREAMSQSSAKTTAFGTSLIDNLFNRLRGLPNTVLYALRNIFRQKTRLALTLIALSMAGAIFVAVVSVRASLIQTIDEISQYWQEDVYIRFYTGHRLAVLEQEVRQVEGVREVEGRSVKSGFRLRNDQSESTDAITVYGINAQSRFLQPRLLAGRWLTPEDTNSVVINIDVQTLEPDIAIGDMITLKINERQTQWHVVGLVTSQVIGGDSLVTPAAYINYPYFAKTMGEVGLVNEILIKTERSDRPFAAQVSDELETKLADSKIRIALKRLHADVRSSLESSFDIVLSLLQLMSLQFAAVSALGLMSMMSLNVLERTREIGVLRVVGGNRNTIAQIVVTEGIFTGVISWLAGVLLAFPLSNYLGAILGRTLINVPLSHYFPASGPALWFVTVIFLATIASLLPAYNASRLSVRETLVYE